MSARLVNVDRRTPLLLPPDLRDWIPADDMVHFVIEAVEGVGLSRFQINERGSGSEQYPPRMMVALLVYCYANGIFSSRRIERATYRDVGVRYLTADTHPDHDTIAKFRRENFEAVADCFVRILVLARELGLLKVGTVSTDGTQIKANASKHRNVTYERAGELIEQLKLDVAVLLEQAGAADNSERDEGQQLPQEMARREKLQAKLEAARERLEAQARAKAESEKAAYVGKVEAREARQGRNKGPKVTPPKEHPRAEQQVNLVDGDRRLMRKNKRSETRKAPKAEWLLAMKAKLETDTGRALYALRKQTAEPVFGIVKEVMGFRQFVLRGLEKVEGEWQRVALAYNMKRLWNLKMAMG